MWVSAAGPFADIVAGRDGQAPVGLNAEGGCVGTRRPRLFFVKLGIGVGNDARERGKRHSARSSDVGEAS